MVRQENAKSKKSISRHERKVERKESRAEKKNVSSRKKAGDKTDRDLVKELAETKKALRATQTQAKHEHQARLKAEKALVEAKPSKLKEIKAQVKRVSFVVRLEIDENGHPRRTEIEETRSRNKQNFQSLDGEDLVTFIKVQAGLKPENPVSTMLSHVSSAEAPALSPKIETKVHEDPLILSSDVQHFIRSSDVSEEKISDEKPQRSGKSAQRPRRRPSSEVREDQTPDLKQQHSGKSAQHSRKQLFKPTFPSNIVVTKGPSDHAVPMPSQPKLQGTLIVSDVKVLDLGTPNIKKLTVKADEAFIVQTSFQLQGPEASYLASQQYTYNVMVYSKEITSGKCQLLKTSKTELVPNTLDYICRVEIPGLSLGIYSISIVISLGPPIMVGGFLAEIVIEVI